MSLDDACTGVTAAELALAHTIPKLPDFKLIFKIQSFSVCSFDSGMKPLSAQPLIETYTEGRGKN